MKTFSLEAYLSDPSLEVVTVEGNPVRIICTDRKSPSGEYQFPVVALRTNKLNGSEYPVFCSSDGKTNTGSQELYFKEVRYKYWITFHKYHDNFISVSGPFDSKEEALDAKDADTFLAVVPVEFSVEVE